RKARKRFCKSAPRNSKGAEPRKETIMKTENTTTTDNIFSGLKVVDFASFIAGPSAAVILSDFGADVIKVEPPKGELWRIGQKIPPQPLSNVPYMWHLTNRNKRGS